jgi:26S proteasome regulatory subunit N7
MGSDPQYAKYPDLALAQHIFTLTNPSSSNTAQLSSLKILQDAINEHKMAPLYRHLTHPVEGVLNSSSDGPSQKPVPASKKSSAAANIIASRKMSHKLDFPWDEKLYEQLEKDNSGELESFQKEEDEAAEKAGETEVQAAKGKRAEFWARVGDKVRFFISTRDLR